MIRTRKAEPGRREQIGQGTTVRAPHAAIADRIVFRRSDCEVSVSAERFGARDIAPCLAAVAARVHGQRAANRSRNAGEKFGLSAAVERGEARELWAGHASFRIDEA